MTKRPLANDKLITIEQAALILGMSENTVSNMIRERKIPFYKFGDANVKKVPVRIRESDLNAFIESFRVDEENA